MSYLIWEFKTLNFTIRMTAEDEFDVDLSWDESGEAAEKIASGEWSVFCAKCAVLFEGVEIGTDYLGNCIYADPKEFRDHIGMNAGGYGSYFSDMVRGAIRDARGAWHEFPKLRAA